MKKGNYIYSTNPDFQIDSNEWQEQRTLPNNEQTLTVQRTNKHRGGKTVTLITGFIGTNDDLEKLSKLLKNKCGTGGSSKDGEAIIQGDKRDQVVELLKKEGYKVKVSGG